MVAAWSEECGVSERAIQALFLAPFLVAVAGIAVAPVSKSLYKWVVAEDGLAETLQVVCYVLTLFLAVRVLRHQLATGNKLLTVLFGILIAGLVFLIGEELNWGQRLFGWVTPESWKSINKQEETNLHNIYGVGATFKWVQMLVGAYGAVLPFWLLKSKSLAGYRETFRAIVPPPVLMPYFLFMFLWRLYRNLMEPPRRFYFVIAEYNEVVELILAMGICLFLVLQVWKLKSQAVALDAEMVPASS